MRVEIERKFLVAGRPDQLDEARREEIEQGYVAIGEDVEVRVRRKGGGPVLTAKRGSGLQRDEVEVDLTDEQFAELWPLTEGRRVEKVRHYLDVGGPTIEVDVYAGDLDGLVTAEVEFPSEQESRDFDSPEWFGPEVTGDRRYSNAALAVDGAPG